MIRPILQAMVLADQVYEDKNTGKKVIAGTFNTLLFTRRRPQPSMNPSKPTTSPATERSQTPDSIRAEDEARFLDESKKEVNDELDEIEELDDENQDDDDSDDDSDDDDTFVEDSRGTEPTAALSSDMPTQAQDANRSTGVNPHVQMIQQLRQAGSPSLYLSLTEVIGHVQLRLRYLDLDDNQVLFEIEMDATSSDPLRTIEYTLPLPSLPAPHTGVYVLELLFGEEPLGSLRITARETN